MRKLMLLAGAGMLLAVGAPAAAKPGKAQSQAKVHMNARGQIDANRNGIADWREQRLIDANANGILDWRERRTVDINRNGIADWRERWIDRDRDGIDDRQEAMMGRYGGAVCPPGLAKKSPACIPPGQAKRIFAEGQRVPGNYNYYTPYGDIPLVIRNQYGLNDDYRYIYRDNIIYVVDPATRLVRDIINVIL
ncbi:MAG TPA: hypothetical protein VFK50_04720 [Sphingomicrobium sp.]|nr:hypothetical protein [Sphingomicrobium sp.]